MDEKRQTDPMMNAESKVSAPTALLQRIGFGRLILGAVGLLVVLALLVPPISLLERLAVVGYETLSADKVSVSHPDGITLQVDPKSFGDRLRVRLESVPRREFLEGSAGAEMKEAARGLPENLEMKSPHYRIKSRGSFSQKIWIDVLVPNDAEPWETLDLYSWNGNAWTWLGGEFHPEVAQHEFIRAEVTELPRSVAVVQAKPRPAVMSTHLNAGDDLDQIELFDTVNPTGLLLGTMGGFAGDVDSLAMPSDDVDCAVIPVLRNWAPSGSVNRGLLSDLLIDAGIQQTHIDNIVKFCAERGFDGVEIDYRGVEREQREAYGSFVEELSAALQEAGLWLSVAIEPPALVEGQWDSAGYDLTRLGQVADEVKIPFPADPDAYAEGGEAHRLLEWATGRMSRYKLTMQVSSLSAAMVEGSNEYRCLSAQEALAPLGTIKTLDEVDEVEPESKILFGLSGSLLSSTPRREAGTVQLRYKDEESGAQTVWLGTAASLARKLAWAKRYHLGGVAVDDLLAEGNMAGVIDVVAAYGTSLEPPTGEPMEVTWTVKSSDGLIDQATSSLSKPAYSWTTPETAGQFEVEASVIGFDHGSVKVTVVEPEPEEMASGTITETETLTETTETEGESEEDEEVDEEDEEVAEPAEEECVLNARFVADVTVPDNTQMEKGEAFDKTWQVQNSGNCAWPEGTVLAFIGGEQMEAPQTVVVPTVEPTGKKDITVPMKAPAEDGVYTGKWQLRSGDTPFGGQLWVKIRVGEPEQAAPPPAPPPSGGGSFELGGHIRDWGFPYADIMHYAGMNWAKVQVRYPQDASGIIAAAHANGFKIQVSALGPASMVTQGDFEQKIANWVAGMAAAGADAIEIWNEPNIDREWQHGHISPQAYTSLLCTAYSAIKNANGGTAVISAAPAPTGYFGGCGPGGCDDQPWLEGLYNAGAAQCMEYIGAHHNAGATSPSATSGHPANPGSTHHSWFFLPQTRLYYNIFRGTRKLFYTEMGYVTPEGTCGSGLPSNFQWGNGTSLAEQGAWLSEAVRLSISTGMVRSVIVWNVDYVRNDCSDCNPQSRDCDPQASFALIRPGGACPTCDALHGVLGTR